MGEEVRKVGKFSKVRKTEKRNPEISYKGCKVVIVKSYFSSLYNVCDFY